MNRIGITFVLALFHLYVVSQIKISLFRSCLLLISDDHMEIREELDLIASLQILSDFGVTMLPIQGL